MNAKKIGVAGTTPSTETYDYNRDGDYVCQARDIKTRPTAERGGKQGHYRPIAKEFRHDGFTFRQIVREGDVAVYEQTWNGCANPSVAYEVVRIRRREAREIKGKIIEAAEVYPRPEARGVDGFTFTNRDKAWTKFSEISLEEPARIGREVN